MKSWKGKLLLALIAPVVLLGGVEVVFRLLDVGYPASFLLEAEVDGEPVWVENPFFTYHVFSPPLARIPMPIVAKKQKPDDVFRIVVLGESAAQGDPIPDFGPPRMLEYTLRHMDPEARVEVINASITAINSHIIREIARELHKLQPDLVILYIGNNEVIGPFGPGTVFSGYMNRDMLIQSVSRINRLRLAQALRFLATWATDRTKPVEFTGVEMFMDQQVPLHDPRLKAVYRRFENNLQAIIREAQRAGADVLLSTVAVNVTDCPPSISILSDDRSPADQSRWKDSFHQGWTMAKIKAWPEALHSFTAAAMLDDRHAELHYWMGVCLLQLGQTGEAKAAFVRAMDLDAFRYRTDSAMNDIIRRIASTHVPSVTLVDAADRFGRHPELGDAELFIDHVHFSFAGTAWLARTWAEAIFAMNPWPHLSRKSGPPEVADLKEQLMYTGMAELSILQEMARRFGKPPFNRQLDSARRLEKDARQMDAILEQMRTAPDHAAVEQYRERIKHYPHDLFFPQNLARHLIALNRFSEAGAVAGGEGKRYPHRRGPRATRAHVLATQGRAEAAADVLFDFQPKHGFFAASSASYLFKLLVAGGYYFEAVQVGRAMAGKARAVDFSWRIRKELAEVEVVERVLASTREALYAGRHDSRVEAALADLVKSHPSVGEAAFMLAVIYQRQGLTGRSLELLQQALGVMNFARAHYHGALWKAEAGHLDEAAELLRRSALHAQDDWMMVNSLAWIWAGDPRETLRDPAAARSLIEQSLQRAETPPAYLLDTLAAVMARQGDFPSALATSLRAAHAAETEGNEELEQEIKRRQLHYENQAPVSWTRWNRPLNFF